MENSTSLGKRWFGIRNTCPNYAQVISFLDPILKWKLRASDIFFGSYLEMEVVQTGHRLSVASFLPLCHGKGSSLLFLRHSAMHKKTTHSLAKEDWTYMVRLRFSVLDTSI
ncbi:hypothetical protein CSKR_203627 [Clonorchis sinensis]|uniref:Uncharacterized protein n=1 Tax=Clonorchis sinensis TaxID=79923 RepID=A0A8T1MUN5_CLOSI|nr:hypothetical protein CSKR_203627 [Clonorchis sinensis]